MTKKLIMKVRRSGHFKLVTIPKRNEITEGDYVEIKRVGDKNVMEKEN